MMFINAKRVNVHSLTGKNWSISARCGPFSRVTARQKQRSTARRSIILSVSSITVRATSSRSSTIPRSRSQRRSMTSTHVAGFRSSYNLSTSSVSISGRGRSLNQFLRTRQTSCTVASRDSSGVSPHSSWTSWSLMWILPERRKTPGVDE